jgi:hypothetical protein
MGMCYEAFLKFAVLVTLKVFMVGILKPSSGSVLKVHGVVCTK